MILLLEMPKPGKFFLRLTHFVQHGGVGAIEGHRHGDIPNVRGRRDHESRNACPPNREEFPPVGAFFGLFNLGVHYTASECLVGARVVIVTDV